MNWDGNVIKIEKVDEYIKYLPNVLKKALVGIALLAASFVVSDDKAEAQTFNVETTYYVSTCEGCIGITAYGYDVRNTIYAEGYRVVAVDPWVIPLGSILYVETPYESYYAMAADTGGAINGSRIDVLVGSYYEAIQKGRVQSTVTVVEWATY